LDTQHDFLAVPEQPKKLKCYKHQDHTYMSCNKY